jgi:hypothetical protein
MGAIDLASYARRSRAVDLDGVDFASVAAVPLAPEVLRVLRYMQDIETHTVIYVRALLHTRAIDDPTVAHFLACWFNEEMAHGRALATFLAAAGAPVVERARSRVPFGERVQEVLTSLVARCWPDFVALHMTWGALNEMTAVQAYRRLAEIAGHPVLSDLLARLVRDEARHFDFYFHQAAMRLGRPGAGRVARLLVDRFWGPVGSGVQPDDEVRFVGRYLFTGVDGWPAAERVDAAVQRLPAFADARPLVSWLARVGAGTDPRYISGRSRTRAWNGRRLARP